MRGGPLVVVGDTLLDVDLHGTVDRVAPDAPVPVVDCQRERHRAGGAGLAAVLAAGLPAESGGSDVVLITALGQDRLGAKLRDLLGRHVQVIPLPLDGGTPCKIRVHASGQPVVRLDAGDGRARPGPPGPQAERVLRQAGAVLVADYGRGVAAHPALTAMLSRLAARRPVVWDPHPAGGPPLPGSRLVTPSRSEAHGFAAPLLAGAENVAGAENGSAGSAIASAGRDAAVLSRAWGSAVAVTLGEGGALLHTGEAVPFLAPAEAIRGPHDSCGAGDCFAAAAAQVLRSGGLLTEAVTEAVRQATSFVRQGGASAAPGSSVPRDDVQVHPVPSIPLTDDLQDADAWRMVAEVRARGGRIVATGGCFDLLHAGHVGLLREARRLGDCLVVCLNSDDSVRALKGPRRPLVPAEDRARILTALECVDAVVIFDEPTPAAVLERLRPDVWVKGGDYSPDDLTEAPVVRRHGGEVVLLPYLIRRSTTALVAAAGGRVAS